jgi:hypothetical protein
LLAKFNSLYFKNLQYSICFIAKSRTKPSVALEHFIVVYSNKQKLNSYEHHETQETTLVQRACSKVTGFKRLHKQLEKKIIVGGKSLSTLNNYMRCIAHVALHFNSLPSQRDIEQIEEYLLMVKKRNTTSSESFFKHTVYGLRFLFRSEGRDARAIQLPSIKRDTKLPVVLSPGKVKLLLKTQQLESRLEYPEEKHWKQISIERLWYNPDACPGCKQLTIITVFDFDMRGPPDKEMINDLIKKHHCLQAS